MVKRGQYGRNDADLIAAARDGSEAAFEELYRSHERAAHKEARRTSSIESDDVVAEAFASVFRAISSGGGPDHNFRSYLRSAVRNAAIQMSRKPASRNEVPVDNIDESGASVVDAQDSDEAYLASVVDDALSALPQRWSEVLWATEVDGRRPRELRQELNISANSVAALSRRAREGFRSEFLNQLGQRNDELHRFTTAHRSAHDAGDLSPMTSALLMAHIGECAVCSNDVHPVRSPVIFAWPVALWLGKASAVAKGALLLGVLGGGASWRSSTGAKVMAGTSVTAVGGLAFWALASGGAPLRPSADMPDTAAVVISAEPAAPREVPTEPELATPTDDDAPIEPPATTSTTSTSVALTTSTSEPTTTTSPPSSATTAAPAVSRRPPATAAPQPPRTPSPTPVATTTVPIPPGTTPPMLAPPPTTSPPTTTSPPPNTTTSTTTTTTTTTSTVPTTTSTTSTTSTTTTSTTSTSTTTTTIPATYEIGFYLIDSDRSPVVGITATTTSSTNATLTLQLTPLDGATGACVPDGACVLDGGTYIFTAANWSSAQPVEASFGFDFTLESTIRLQVVALADGVEVTRRTATITYS